VAAMATYGVALLERGFEVFESALGEIGRNIAPAEAQHSTNDRARDRPGDRPEVRS
jgi:hypothetical protein